jgi:hypothetical protein
VPVSKQLIPGNGVDQLKERSFGAGVTDHPLMQGQMVTNVTLVAGELTLRHRLGRPAVGCVLALTDREITFRVTSNRPDRLVLYITSQANPVPAGGKANFYVW